jgi:hypothetical protein
MTKTKMYQTILGARFAILRGRIKSFFTGSHYVAETYTLKYNTATKEYVVEHYTMTRDEEQMLHKALAAKQQEIERLVKIEQELQIAELADQVANGEVDVPTMKSDKPKKRYYKPKAKKNTQKNNA